MITEATMQTQSMPAMINDAARACETEDALIFNYNSKDAETEFDKNIKEDSNGDNNSDGGFLNSIKNFFKGIGNFFKNLFDKKDDEKAETKNDTEDATDYKPIKPADGEVTIDINEEIEDFSQGELGDCWFLSAIETLSSTQKGSKIIKDAIEKNGDNTYSVTFKGLKTSYDVTEEELIEAKKEGRVSRGDDDVILLEIAADKALKDVKENPDKFLDNDYASYISFLSSNPKNDKSYNYVSAGANLDVAAAMFGCDLLNNSRQINIAISADDTSISDKIDEIKNLDLNNMMTEIAFDTDILESVKGADGNNIATAGMHSYSIKSINDNVITLTNPWNTAHEVSYNLDDIADKILQVNYCYLD